MGVIVYTYTFAYMIVTNYKRFVTPFIMDAAFNSNTFNYMDVYDAITESIDIPEFYEQKACHTGNDNKLKHSIRNAMNALKKNDTLIMIDENIWTFSAGVI